MYVAFTNVRQATALELSSWEEVEGPQEESEDQADDIFLKYASSYPDFKGGILIILENDQFVVNDGQKS